MMAMEAPETKGAVESPVAWLNGALLPLAEAAVSPLDRGFQYGDGLFETLRADRGRVCYLDRHLRRLTGSARHLRLPAAFLEALPWAEIVAELLRRNHLEASIARLKVLVTRGCAVALGLPEVERPTVLVTAAPYRSPSPEDYLRGWSVHLGAPGFTSPLAAHKSLNYLIFLAARQEALERGKDEAILVAADGRLCETAAGSLLFYRAGTWLHPLQPLQLPGITLGRAVELLRDQGCSVQSLPITVSDLDRLDGAWILNSLIGIMPIREIDGRMLSIIQPDLIAAIRGRLLIGG